MTSQIVWVADEQDDWSTPRQAYDQEKQDSRQEMGLDFTVQAR
jgi:hypothetical protein